MVQPLEKTSITPEKLPSFVFNLAIQLKAIDAGELAPIIIKVIEEISQPQLSFAELPLAQQAIIIQFIAEILPQLSTELKLETTTAKTE